MKTALLTLLILLTSCRIYDREYITTIPIPEVRPDTLTPGDWDNHPIKDTL